MLGSLRLLWLFLSATILVIARRLVRGPQLSSWNLRYEILVRFLKTLLEKLMKRSAPEARALMSRVTGPICPGVRLRHDRIAGIEVLIFEPPTLRDDVLLLYAHGGGYVMGSPAQERSFSSKLAANMGRRVVSVDYRLAPEFPCPAAQDDLIEVYEELQSSSPAAIIMCGLSAGAGLVAASVQRLVAMKRELPLGAIFFSPYVNCTCNTPSWKQCAETDWIQPGAAQETARVYAGSRPLDDPAVSPLYGSFEGFPPLLVFSGDAECVRDDALLLAEKATAAHVETMSLVEPQMTHAYMSFLLDLPPIHRCVELSTQFVERLASRSPGARARPPTGTNEQMH